MTSGRLIDRAGRRGLAGTVGISEEARERVMRMADSDARKALTRGRPPRGTVWRHLP